MMTGDEMRKALRDAPLPAVAAAIRRSRRGSGMTLDQLAKAVGSTRQHLIGLEKGRHRPRPAMLTRIAEATGNTVDALLPDTEAGFRDAA